jgi:hypothetical protein
LQDSSDVLADNREAAEDMAITQWEMQDALADLKKNFDDYA